MLALWPCPTQLRLSQCKNDWKELLKEINEVQPDHFHHLSGAKRESNASKVL
jgi:hypothetical protein